jgi:hypothetical protein
MPQAYSESGPAAARPDQCDQSAGLRGSRPAELGDGQCLPAFDHPPPTDVDVMPLFWSSFNIAPKHVQSVAGG